ncbi:MAG: hypothetical protein V1820_04115 [archaeon]
MVRNSNLLGIVFAVFIFGILVFSGGYSATATKKILFYEVQAPATMRITGTGYTRFNGLLQGTGYSTASISSSEVKLTQEKLLDYDVVVMQGLVRPLDTEEILALRWYVGVQGGGLLINGDEPDGVNNLGQIYGILMDKSTTWLVDTSSFPFNETGPDGIAIPAADRKYYALVRTFPDKTDPQGTSMTDVSKVAIYKAHPLFVESVRVNSPIGKTKVIATGSNLSYTETGTFPVGSEPPIAARAFFGNGAVVVFSDFDMLSDVNIFDRDYFNESINNDKFGLSVINWLSDKSNRELSIQSESELAVKVLQLQSANIAFEYANRTLANEKAALQSNLSATISSYEGALSSTRQSMQAQVTKCETSLGSCNTAGLKKLGIGWLIGLVLGAGGLGAFLLYRKFGGKRKPGLPGKQKQPEKAVVPQQKKEQAGRQEKLDEVVSDSSKDGEGIDEVK